MFRMEGPLKRKRVSKKSKRAWRKTNTTDVDDYLDEKRLEERLGGPFDKRNNCDLFVYDKVKVGGKTLQSYNEKIAAKKKRSLESPRCFHIMQPWSSVPDPITKRNIPKVQHKQKRSVKKKTEAEENERAVAKKSDNTQKCRRQLLTKQSISERGVFDKNIWDVKPVENILGSGAEWMSEETVRHNLIGLGKFKVRAPKTFMKATKIENTSTVPATEVPHPGASYNPSFTDHQNLLKKVSEKEEKLMKEQAHIQRVTTDLFSKVTADERHKSWLSEMSEGLHREVNYEENGGEYKAINPPTRRDKKKTLQKRRRLREAGIAKGERKNVRVEKKKVSDIYRLRYLCNDIEKKAAKQALLRKKREKKIAALAHKPKHLSLHRFVEPDVEFNRCHEISGSLRCIKPEGNLLADRFFSLQKRNIIEPTVKINKIKKKKVKRFVKASHKVPAAV